MSGEALLIVHGLTEFIRDKQIQERMTFRRALATAKIASHEFDYRGRGDDSSNDLAFSLRQAREDLDGVLTHLFAEEKLDRLWLVARGMGAVVVLGSSEALKRKCSLILWQPIFYPKRTMERRGHLAKFQATSATASGHVFVKLQGIRLGKAFFDGLADATPDRVWDNARIDILYTRGDKVSPAEWIEEFVATVKADEARNCEISLHLLDTEDAPQDHLHLSSMMAFSNKTLEILAKERRESEPLETGNEHGVRP